MSVPCLLLVLPSVQARSSRPGPGVLRRCFRASSPPSPSLSCPSCKPQRTPPPPPHACVSLALCRRTDCLSPESPRWLVHEGYYEEARLVVAQTNSRGDTSHPEAIAIYKEILDAIEWEKKQGKTMSPMEIIKTPTSRRRFLIGMSASPFSGIVGNIIASYYLGDELDTAGITNPNSQLQAVCSPCPRSNFQSSARSC